MARSNPSDERTAHAGAPSRPRWRRLATSRAVGVGLGLALGTSILRVAAGRPDWIRSWHVTAAFLLLAGGLILASHRRRAPPDGGLEAALTPLRLGLLTLLLVVVIQSSTPGVGLGIDRAVEVTTIFVALLAFCVLAVHPREYSPGQWLFVACFAAVAGVFFYHSVPIAEVSARSRQPIWWGVLAGVTLFVVPRYVPTDRFLWTMNRLAALLVLLTLPIYVLGEYSLLGIEFAFHRAYDLPLLDREVRATRSLFVNRNAFAEIAFAGIVAGVAETHRTVRGGGPTVLVGLPASLLAINLFGLALAYDRSMWVITPVAVGIYLAYAAFGRRSIPLSVTAGIAFLAGGLLAVYLGILDTHTSNRFELWRAAAAAIADRPSLLGEGLMWPGRFIADYHDLGSVSTHNSYFSIWIRTGIVGGVAYALLVAGSVVWGATRYRDVDVAALAIAGGFAAHQLFEAYTLFQSGMGSVLAGLAVGFLLFGVADDRSGTSGTTASSDPPESGDGTASATGSAADYVGTEADPPEKTPGTRD